MDLNQENASFMRQKAAFVRHTGGHFRSKLDGVTVKKRLGQNVQKLRVSANLTQNQLSEFAAIDRSFLQRIEAGTSNPSTEVLLRLKKALKCTWDQIFDGLD